MFDGLKPLSLPGRVTAPRATREQLVDASARIGDRAPRIGIPDADEEFAEIAPRRSREYRWEYGFGSEGPLRCS
jgi:hypothetical protein